MNIRRFFVFTMITLGCQHEINRPRKSFLVSNYHKNMEYEVIINRDSSMLLFVTYNDTGRVKSVSVANNGGPIHEVVWYYDNGKVKSKTQGTDSVIHGRQYYFYESGNLEGVFNWEYGIKMGVAYEYFESTGQIKSEMLYNNQGQLCYKVSFGENGEILDIEGDTVDNPLYEALFKIR